LVVDRHRRLQQLLDMGAPEIIVGNEKRMLLAALKRMPALARETDQAPAYEKGRA
jgi:DNA-directed RNA polymerase beta' subunit